MRGGWLQRFRQVAWVVPFAYGLLLTAASLFWLARGGPFDTNTWSRIVGSPWNDFLRTEGPATANFAAAAFRELGGGLGLLGGVLAMSVAATAFRRGERWARGCLWVLPLHALADLVIVAAHGGLNRSALVWDLGLFLVLAAALVAGRPAPAAD
jgi:hypothetical protein